MSRVALVLFAVLLLVGCGAASPTAPTVTVPIAGSLPLVLPPDGTQCQMVQVERPGELRAELQWKTHNRTVYFTVAHISIGNDPSVVLVREGPLLPPARVVSVPVTPGQYSVCVNQYGGTALPYTLSILLSVN